MHPADTVSAASTAIDPRAAREAAQWLMRLHEGQPDGAQQQAFEAWRSSDPAHAAAWARAELVCRTLSMVPPGLRAPAGDEPALPSRQRRITVKHLALLIASATPLWLASRSAPWQAFRAQTRTARGEIRHLALPDGSQLVLNTDTAIDVAFDQAARLVTLHAGEIYVTTHEAASARAAPARPLIVRSLNGSVRALGTRFTVRQGDSLFAPSTQVAVIEGAVEIRPLATSAGPALLRQGWQLGFDGHATDAAIPVAPDADAWRDGMLIARRTPLGQVAGQLARYRPGVLRCHPAVAHLAVDGIFQLKDTDRILQLLAISLPVRIRSTTRYWVSIEPV